MLRALDEIEQEQGDGAKQKHGDAVFFPIHFVGFVNGAQAVDEALDGAAKWIEEGSFAGENAREKDSDRLGDGENDGKKEEDLKDADGSHD